MAERPDVAPHPGTIRILLVSNMWPSEGSPVFGSFVARQAECLQDAGAEVIVVANADRRRGPLRALLKYSSLGRRVRAAARAGGFDVVVGHYLYPTASFALEAARIAGVPLVLVSHGTDARSVMRDDRFGRRGREALSHADLVVAVSAALRQTLRDEVGVPERVPIEVVNMGFDAGRFRPDPDARHVLGVPAGERVVLFAGNLEPVKGLDVLLDAFERVIAEGGADRLVIVGDGPLRGVMEERVAASSTLGECVRFAGQLPQPDLARWMAAADVFVLPSRAEGLGLVLLEAMACGTPCVATRVGGVPEILDEDCGALVAPDDPAALAAAIASVMARGKEPYSEACRARASHHTSTVKAREFLAHVREVVAGRE
ncbi:MAG: glycosyltransferase [Coriobacteriia bacterium]|nr:glycosyltransferase [Coriobacteriia bacterium]